MVGGDSEMRAEEKTSQLASDGSSEAVARVNMWMREWLLAVGVDGKKMARLLEWFAALLRKHPSFDPGRSLCRSSYAKVEHAYCSARGFTVGTRTFLHL